MTEPYLGRIEVAPRAIESIAGLAVLESYGVVGMAPKDSSSRERLAEYMAALLPRANFRRGVAVTCRDGRIAIDLYVVIEYGTRISEVAVGIKNRVKYIVERDTGLTVAQVNVHVQGLRVSNDR
ncbi:MAG: hypothetical protein HDKAJFGB_02230 [Anaerolineae bacterium]|nr:hypothetical protein [Anaerolineae bacterium]MDL1896345.1 Asp23/Gls24 family envelope stress response protein [Anaerolineae bacterium CFX7]RIK15932.1 MAG: Asp23/Gls24 family envelope stress response protein [Chloroflexota bacterium]